MRLSLHFLHSSPDACGVVLQFWKQDQALPSLSTYTNKDLGKYLEAMFSFARQCSSGSYLRQDICQMNQRGQEVWEIFRNRGEHREVASTHLQQY